MNFQREANQTNCQYRCLSALTLLKTENFTTSSQKHRSFSECMFLHSHYFTFLLQEEFYNTCWVLPSSAMETALVMLLGPEGSNVVLQQHVASKGTD